MYTLKGISFQGIEPQIDEEAFVAPQVFLSGDVRVARYASFWPGAVARGDVSYISVGECSNVQDLVCLHVADDAPCIIRDYVTIGHGAVIHGCEIADHVLIGRAGGIERDFSALKDELRKALAKLARPAAA